jgi:hypothetical protein
MATIGATVLTLADWAKRLDPDGKTAAIVEMLSQDNGVLDTMLFKEGNLPTGEQTTIRTGLPTVYYRLLNQGVPKSKSTTAQIVENAALLEARSEVDVDEAELNGNIASYRLSEASAFMEAMRQQMATTLFYGTGANPEEFVGFAPRYSDLGAANAENILDGGGTGVDMSSVWLVNWGANKVFGVFPKGSSAGLKHEDLGVGDAFDSNNDRFRAYMDRFVWKNGLVVKDWRNVVRICNVDTSELIGLTGAQELTDSTLVTNLMSRAIDRLPNGPDGNATFYANRTILSNLRVVAQNKSNNVVTIEPGLNQFGRSIMETRFLGIPVKLTDALTITETQIT